MSEVTDLQQSKVFDAMRFPLIVLVLYMHIVPLEHFEITSDLTSMNLYNFIAEFVAHNLGRMAVPCFFLFSGYFYFRNMKAWGYDFYLKQQKKRMITLVIPYVLWNLLNIGVVLAKGYIFNAIGWNGEGDLNYIRETPFLELMTFPINQPLWSLRDLIVMTFFAPVFFYIFRYLKGWGLVLLLLIYLSTLELPIRGFSMVAIFFFGAGSYFGIEKRNLLADLIPFKWLSYIGATVLVFLATISHTTPYYEYLIRCFVPLGIISAITLTHTLSQRNRKLFNSFISLSSSVFFIYAVHELYLKNWVKGAFFRTPLADSGWGMIVGYILMPLVLLAICLVIYYLLKLISPRLVAVLTGGRI